MAGDLPAAVGERDAAGAGGLGLEPDAAVEAQVRVDVVDLGGSAEVAAGDEAVGAEAAGAPVAGRAVATAPPAVAARAAPAMRSVCLVMAPVLRGRR